MTFSAVILAGGKSSRMGRDKGLLEVGGQPLLARQIQLARAAGAGEVFISGRRDNDYAEFGCPVLWDRFPDSGPLGGIQMALAAATASHLLVLAVDMPHMHASALRQLATHGTETAGAIPRISGGIEPLAAFYPKAAAGLAVELLENRCGPRLHSAKHFAERCVAVGFAAFVELSAQDAQLFANWNSPVDIGKLSSAA